MRGQVGGARVDNSDPPAHESVCVALIVQQVGCARIGRKFQHGRTARLTFQFQRPLVGRKCLIRVGIRERLVGVAPLAHAPLGHGHELSIAPEGNAGEDALLGALLVCLEMESALQAVGQIQGVSARRARLVVSALHNEAITLASLNHQLGYHQAIDVPGYAPTWSSRDGLVAAFRASRGPDLGVESFVLRTDNARHKPAARLLLRLVAPTCLACGRVQRLGSLACRRRRRGARESWIQLRGGRADGQIGLHAGVQIGNGTVPLGVSGKINEHVAASAQPMVADLFARIQLPDRPHDRLLAVAIDVLVVELVHAELGPLEGDHRVAVHDGPMQQGQAVAAPLKSGVGTAGLRAGHFCLAALLFAAQKVVNCMHLARLALHPGDHRVGVRHFAPRIVLAQAEGHILGRLYFADQLHDNVVAIEDPANFVAQIVVENFAIQFVLRFYAQHFGRRRHARLLRDAHLAKADRKLATPQAKIVKVVDCQLVRQRDHHRFARILSQRLLGAIFVLQLQAARRPETRPPACEPKIGVRREAVVVQVGHQKGLRVHDSDGPRSDAVSVGRRRRRRRQGADLEWAWHDQTLLDENVGQILLALSGPHAEPVDFAQRLALGQPQNDILARVAFQWLCGALLVGHDESVGPAREGRDHARPKIGVGREAVVVEAPNEQGLFVDGEHIAAYVVVAARVQPADVGAKVLLATPALFRQPSISGRLARSGQSAEEA